MDLYEALKSVHILAVAAWFGAGVTVQVLAGLARRAGPERTAAFVQDASKLSNTLFMPASFVALGTGIWMVVESPAWSFADLWITLGFAGFIATAITGMAVLGPTGKKLAQMIPAKGPEDAEAQRLLARLFNVGRVDLVVLALVIVDMVVKPT